MTERRVPVGSGHAGAAIERLVPPRVEPAANPVRFPFNLVRTLTDNVALVPRQAYEEDVVLAPGPPRMAFVTGPGAVETLLMSRDGRFSPRAACRTPSSPP